MQTCECGFQYHSSEIALSKRAAGAREEPDSAPIADVHLTSERRSHNQQSHVITMCLEVTNEGKSGGAQSEGEEVERETENEA